MKIYIDFDDCLCETARAFSRLVNDLFGIHVPYEDMRYFDLQKSFSLTDEQYEQMMVEAHRPDALMSYQETPGAVKVVNGWMDRGHEVSIITGRPYSAYEPSRLWLDRHGLARVRLYCLNKYGRSGFNTHSEYSLEVEDFYPMHFDCAIEDSPSAFHFFDHLPRLKVMVFDRPWNQGCAFPTEHYHRCLDWKMIEEATADVHLDQ